MSSETNRTSQEGVNRRNFLSTSAATFGIAGLAGPLAFLETKRAAASAGELCGTRAASPYGPLYPTKDMATGLELIMLPKGFKYTTFSWSGDSMSDGNLVPTGHDGMAVVKTIAPGKSAGKGKGKGPDGNALEVVLIRNHENFYSGPTGDSAIASDFNYDATAGGGTTVLTVKHGELIGDHISISGTTSNCAGGPTPWGTWLTCEEEIAGPDVTSGFYTGTAPVKHGYVFESTIERVTDPTPLTAMGRFSHEAVAIDPRNGTIYLTEDNSANGSSAESPRRRGQSGFYKFVPNDPLGGVGSLEAGGRLYMLKALQNGTPVSDLRDPACFASYDVQWVEILVPDSSPVGAQSGPYAQGRAQGGTRFQRLEGAWWHPLEKTIVFCDTEGGPIGAEAGRTDRAEGAVWAYDPETNRLHNLFVSQGALAPAAYGSDNPDNVTVSPNGGIMMCEDGGGSDGDGCSLLGLLPNGQTFEFARNSVYLDLVTAALIGKNVLALGPIIAQEGPDFSGSEFAGATFDPTGRWLFVNIQSPGITFAITGPWQKGIF